MTGKTIRVKENTHSTFFSIQKLMQLKSSDECLKILMIDWHSQRTMKGNLDDIYKGIYQIEEKS